MYSIWIKEAGSNWRKLRGSYGAWENKDSAIRHAKRIASGYVAITVEDAVGAVIFRG